MWTSSKQQRLVPLVAVLLLLAGGGLVLSDSGAGASDKVPLARDYNYPSGETPETFQGPVGRAECGPGSTPETGQLQGQVAIADRESGRSAHGYSCNMELVGRYGPKDGFEGAEWQLARYKDQAGRQCAYYSQPPTTASGC
jgi:hypothetical protein